MTPKDNPQLAFAYVIADEALVGPSWANLQMCLRDGEITAAKDIALSIQQTAGELLAKLKEAADA